MITALSRLELQHLCVNSTHTTLQYNIKMAQPGTATRPMCIRMLRHLCLANTANCSGLPEMYDFSSQMSHEVGEFVDALTPLKSRLPEVPALPHMCHFI
jgi:hypothetical protein